AVRQREPFFEIIEYPLPVLELSHRRRLRLGPARRRLVPLKDDFAMLGDAALTLLPSGALSVTHSKLPTRFGKNFGALFVSKAAHQLTPLIHASPALVRSDQEIGQRRRKPTSSV